MLLANNRPKPSLRAEGVLILGSGGAVHNLREWRAGDATGPAWAQAFDDWLAETSRRAPWTIWPPTGRQGPAQGQVGGRPAAGQNRERVTGTSAYRPADRCDEGVSAPSPQITPITG